MSASAAGTRTSAMTEAQARRIRRFDIAGLALTLLTVLCAIIWAFPLYWAIVTTLKPEHEVTRPYIEMLPETWSIEAYVHVLTNTKIGYWYINSLATSAAITVVVILMGMMAGYAISRLNFPGRRVLWWTILASFMIPIPALIVNHYILMSDVGFLNSWLGIIVPQLIAPVVVIVYKQFFDSVPREFSEAAIIDGANHFQLLFRIYVPTNWGVTTALAVITFIGGWNAFLWPFLAATTEDMMTITVGITQVNDAFGVFYARDLAAAVMAGLPVAIIYLIFQRRVTQAITLSAGIKG